MEFHGYRYVVFSFSPVVISCLNLIGHRNSSQCQVFGKVPPQHLANASYMALDLLFGLRPVKSGPVKWAEQVAYTSAPPKSKINYHILWKEHLKKH